MGQKTSLFISAVAVTVLFSALLGGTFVLVHGRPGGIPLALTVYCLGGFPVALLVGLLLPLISLPDFRKGSLPLLLLPALCLLCGLLFPLVGERAAGLFSRITVEPLELLLRSLFWTAIALLPMVLLYLLPVSQQILMNLRARFSVLILLLLPVLLFWSIFTYLRFGAVLGAPSFVFVLAAVLAGGLLASLALGPCCLRQTGWGAVPLLLVAAAAGLLVPAYSTPTKTAELMKVDAFSSFAIERLRGASDFDGDGASSFFGGGDCDGLEAGIFPGANDLAGNGVDEDCDGKDAVASRGIDMKFDDASAIVEFARARHWNVVIVLADALRADSVQVLGAPRETTPVLNSLKGEALVFSKAVSQSSCSRKSIPSSFTGRYPEYMAWDQTRKSYGMKQENNTVAEVFRAAGYETMAVINPWLQSNIRGFSQGFARTSVFYKSKDWKKATLSSSPKAVFKAVDMMEKRRPQKPFLMFLYLEDAHHSYVNHGFPAKTFGKKAKDRYDSEISFVDAWAGVFFQYLRERGLWDKTIVLVYSDHGEEFKEHGQTQHCKQLYVESIRVPLVLRIPGIRGRVIDEPVALVDVLPTLLDATGVPHPDRSELQGRSLLRYLDGNGSAGARPIFSFVRDSASDVRSHSLLLWPWHLLQNAGAWELYNLDDDPGEKANLLPTSREQASKLRTIVDAFLRKAFLK